MTNGQCEQGAPAPGHWELVIRHLLVIGAWSLVIPATSDSGHLELNRSKGVRMAHPSYDLVVIGSGPAGQKAALGAAKLGKRVAVVEREHHVGGVCIHTGTIPSKAIREAVLHLTGLRERQVYGDSYVVKHDITMHDLLHRARHVIKTEVDVIRSQMGRNGVAMFSGHASFSSPHSIHIENG